MKHPQYDEVVRFLDHLAYQGFFIDCVNDGTVTARDMTIPQAADWICELEECSLYVKDEARFGSKQFWIALVLGNGPGELAADYTFTGPLDHAITTWSTKEEKRYAAEEDLVTTISKELNTVLKPFIGAPNSAETREKMYNAVIAQLEQFKNLTN